MKWDKYYHLPEIEEIRKKIKEAYSNKLTFLEESHEYFLEGEKCICVSELIHQFQSSNSLEMAERCVKKWKRENDPSYKYYGKSVDEILSMWKKVSGEACDFGTEVHEFGEAMFYYMTENYEAEAYKSCVSKGKFKDGKPCPSNNQEKAIMDFWYSLPETFVPVLAETKVFNRKGQLYAGTFDILFYYVNESNPLKNGLYILDYKTNSDLRGIKKAQYDNRLKYPFENYKDVPESIYTLQLAAYQIPMENLGFKVLGRVLIWLRHDEEGAGFEKVPLKEEAPMLRKFLGIPPAKQILEEGI